MRTFGFRTHAAACLGLAAVLMAPTAYAVDGVMEINQTCAINGGCFTGDTAGFPVTIDGGAGGSYRLTGNLTISDANTTAILLTAAQIAIDMNGFSITGPGSCSGDPNACVLTDGTGKGIDTQTSGLTGQSVRNGSVRGMGSIGVRLGDGAIVEGVQAEENRGGGIVVFSGAMIQGCTARRNGDVGLYSAGAGGVVESNTAFRNTAAGISTFAASTIRGNSSWGNAGDGILAGAGSLVESNTAESNHGYGINLGTDGGYRSNVVSTVAGSSGTVNGGVELGGNLCDGATTCP